MELLLIKTPLTGCLERARQTLGRRVGVALVRLRLKLWTPNLFSVQGCQAKPFQDAFSSSSWMKLLRCWCSGAKRTRQGEMEGERGKREKFWDGDKNCQYGRGKGWQHWEGRESVTGILECCTAGKRKEVTGKGLCDYKGTVSSSLSFCSSLLLLIIDTVESWEHLVFWAVTKSQRTRKAVTCDLLGCCALESRVNANIYPPGYVVANNILSTYM